MNVYAAAVLISVFVLFILITGLLVAYLLNKGFYKGFFYPEYRFSIKLKVSKTHFYHTFNHFLVDNQANEKVHYIF